MFKILGHSQNVFPRSDGRARLKIWKTIGQTSNSQPQKTGRLPLHTDAATAETLLNWQEMNRGLAKSETEHPIPEGASTRTLKKSGFAPSRTRIATGLDPDSTELLMTGFDPRPSALTAGPNEPENRHTSTRPVDTSKIKPFRQFPKK
jgi:hypothetical protein